MPAGQAVPSGTSSFDEASISTLSSIDAWDVDGEGGLAEFGWSQDSAIPSMGSVSRQVGSLKAASLETWMVETSASSTGRQENDDENRGGPGDVGIRYGSQGGPGGIGVPTLTVAQVVALPADSADPVVSPEPASAAAGAAPGFTPNVAEVLLRRADAAAGDSLPLPAAAATVIISDGELGRAAGRVARVGGGGARSGRPAKRKASSTKSSVDYSDVDSIKRPVSPATGQQQPRSDFNDGQIAVGTS